MKKVLTLIVAALIAGGAMAQSASPSKPACENLKKIIKCFEENRYADLSKAGTEKKGVTAYSVRSEPSVLPEFFTEGYVLKNSALEYWSANFKATKLASKKGTEIYNNVKHLFSGWTFTQKTEKTEVDDPSFVDKRTEAEALADELYEMETGESLIPQIPATLNYYEYTKGKVKVKFTVLESEKISEISLDMMWR